jgi:multidrug efflux pump subunit AcrA (membrane-fusion protein)
MLQHILDTEEVKAQAAAAKAAAQAQRQAVREQKRAQNEAKRAASQSRTRPSREADTIMIDAEPSPSAPGPVTSPICA